MCTRLDVGVGKNGGELVVSFNGIENDRPAMAALLGKVLQKDPGLMCSLFVAPDVTMEELADVVTWIHGIGFQAFEIFGYSRDALALRMEIGECTVFTNPDDVLEELETPVVLPPEVDGNLNESITLPTGIREVQFGRERTTVWTQRVADTWRKLGEMRVPRVEFVNTAPGDVLEYVRVMVTEGTGNPEMEFKVEWEDATVALPPVTLTLERASPRDIMRAVDEALGVRTELNADGSGWVVRRGVRLEDVVVPDPQGDGEEDGE
jgi:hypothetical protein